MQEKRSPLTDTCYRSNQPDRYNTQQGLSDEAIAMAIDPQSVRILVLVLR